MADDDDDHEDDTTSRTRAKGFIVQREALCQTLCLQEKFEAEVVVVVALHCEWTKNPKRYSKAD